METTIVVLVIVVCWIIIHIIMFLYSKVKTLEEKIKKIAETLDSHGIYL